VVIKCLQDVAVGVIDLNWVLVDVYMRCLVKGIYFSPPVIQLSVGNRSNGTRST
jgi:hypothetical protein